MTIKQAEDIGEMWYQRYIKLKTAYYNEPIGTNRGLRLFILVFTMNQRIANWSIKISKVRSIKYERSFEPGGIIIKPMTNNDLRNNK